MFLLLLFLQNLGYLNTKILPYFCGLIFRFQIFLLCYVVIHYLLLLDLFVNVCSFQFYVTVTFFFIVLHIQYNYWNLPYRRCWLPCHLSVLILLVLFFLFQKGLEYFGRFSFLVTASISLFVASINFSTVCWFFGGIQDLLDGFLNVSPSVRCCVCKSHLFLYQMFFCQRFFELEQSWGFYLKVCIRLL